MRPNRTITLGSPTQQSGFGPAVDLFTARRPTHESTDPVRTDGRETLARTLPEDGARTGADGAASSDASGSGGKDEGRNGHPTRRN